VVVVAVAATRGSTGGLTLFQADHRDQAAATGAPGKDATDRARPGVLTAPAPKKGAVQRPMVVVEGTALKPLPEKALRRSKLADLAERLRNKKADSTAIPAFTVAMLNILGSQHSAGPGGFGPGTSRASTATQMLLSRGASIIGFSEIQRDQLGVFTRNAPAFGVYPGDAAGSQGVPQSLAWDTNVWELKESSTFSIPFSHQVRPQPVVRLSNVETGNDVWVVNIHNSPEGMQAERNRASAIEIDIINNLMEDGIPVVLIGDFNEKGEVMCRFTGATALVSAVGGTSDGGVCRPPARPRVDWIFASPGLTQESFLVTRAAPVPRITDHAALFSTLSHP